MARVKLQVIKSGGQFMPSTEYDAVKIEEYKEGHDKTEAMGVSQSGLGKCFSFGHFKK